MPRRIAALLWLAAVPAWAAAQGITLRGTVRASDSLAAVGVQIRIPGLQRTASTDSAGAFILSDVASGRWRVELRRVGFAPLDTVIDVDASSPATLRFVVQRMAQELDTTIVAARAADAVPASATIPEFEARRARGAGRFITAAQLRAENDRSILDILVTHVPGLLLERAYDGVHGYNPSQQPPGALRGNAGRKCYVQVIVDGSAIYHMSSGQPVNGTPPDLSEFLTQSLDGVEYYSVPSRTPPEFRTEGAMCGTLVFWSRRR